MWARLPAVDGEVIEAGCYGISAGGRERLRSFAGLRADDAHVRRCFAASERRVLEDVHFLLVLPTAKEVVQVARRWRDGNRDLGADDPSAPARGNVTWALGTPSLWRHLPAFAGLQAAAALLPPRSELVRSRSTRALPGSSRAGRRPRVHVVVVTYDSREVVEACLESLRSRLADLTVTVVDNASRDDTVAVVRARRGVERRVVNPTNRGFAAAVNQAADGADADLLLLLNPDVVLEAHAVDHLVAVADRFPERGLVGGRAVDATGRLDPSTCLALPSLSVGTALCHRAERRARRRRARSRRPRRLAPERPA